MKPIGLALAAMGALAFTGVAASAEDAQDSQEESQPEKKICRTDKATGSLTRRTRICMTAAQWRELNARTRRGVDEMTGAAAGSQEVINNPNAGGQGGGPGAQ